MNIWLIIFGMALVTYIPRLIPLTTTNEAWLPVWLKRALDYVPITVLSAIVGTELLPSEGWLNYTVDAHLLAGVVAIGIAWFTRNTIKTIIGGVAVLLLFDVLIRL